MVILELLGMNVIRFIKLSLTLAVVLFTAACSQYGSGCSISSTLNPDISCRVLDADGQRHLVEYFDSDTNVLRLYVQDGSSEVRIEHPYGKVDKYFEKLDLNHLTFDPNDVNSILVNGVKFPITPVN